MKMKEFGPQGGGGASLAPPLRSANENTSLQFRSPQISVDTADFGFQMTSVFK